MVMHFRGRGGACRASGDRTRAFLELRVLGGREKAEMLIRPRQGCGRAGVLKREEKRGWEEARELPGEIAVLREAYQTSTE